MSRSKLYFPMTILSFGPYIAPLVLATLAAPFRFAGRKQVIRLAGLNLNASRSGKRNKAPVALTVKGSINFANTVFDVGFFEAINFFQTPR